ncbi:STY4528 family pathogenicity island replication protein [Actinobacillus pleuropneumoniae]|uniref:STY4528 family pathogenicity island replication protein n=1 Tax=Actinobacillus TaxID=713 RepID=UPI0024427759|nr:STY4528 family pathogenicity island replication protein [Actinobacillus genomosp. 1]WGE34762.1 STY4528 family pathogenicity island replication protein [Actinobacillus genomosp. 1]
MKITQQNKRTEHGLLFFGNQHETVPTRLLHDPYLTPRAKFAWQLIKCNAREFQSGLFPSYDVLGKLLSDKPYTESRLSEKAITQTLYLLRLTRWLTLCETVRNEKGYVMGNVYLLHDEPIPILDAIQLNDEYLTFLEKCANHHDGLVNSVANHIIEHLLSDKTQWHYVSHLESMQVRYREYQQRIAQIPQDSSLPKKELQNLQQNILTSNMEVRDKNVEVREKSAKSLTSNMEVRDKNEANSLSLDSLPLGKSGKQYSTSTLYINKYCTGNAEELIWPAEISLSTVEKNMAAKAMNGLDLGLCRAILLEAQQRIIQKQDVKKPSGYLYTLIQKAHQGNFKPYYFELGQQVSNKPISVKPVSIANKSNAIGTTQEKKISPMERERLVKQMKQLRMQLCPN